MRKEGEGTLREGRRWRRKSVRETLIITCIRVVNSNLVRKRFSYPVDKNYETP